MWVIIRTTMWSAAVAAGFHAVWINRERISWPDDLPQPQHQVSDLHQLEALLEGRDPDD